MTTATIVETTKTDKADRSISHNYTAGNYRVTVRTSYYASTKSYYSSVVESRLEFHGDYTTAISNLNIGLSPQLPEHDFYKAIQTVKVARYNFKDLEKYHALAVYEANDSLTIAELFLKGQTNSEIYGKDI
jgi:hypothetical protein